MGVAEGLNDRNILYNLLQYYLRQKAVKVQIQN